jgi:hypothetical protein
MRTIIGLHLLHGRWLALGLFILRANAAPNLLVVVAVSGDMKN